MLKFWRIDLLALALFLPLSYFTFSTYCFHNLNEDFLAYMRLAFIIIGVILAAVMRASKIKTYESMNSDSDSNRFNFALPLFLAYVVFAVMFSALNLTAPILSNTAHAIDNAGKRIDQENKFRHNVNFTANVIIQYNSDIMGGIVTLENHTAYDWESVYILLNPNVETTRESIAFKLGAEDGFRAPGDNSRVYTRIPAGESLTIPLNEFLQTKTGEIFRSDRYHLRKAYVKATIQHNGQPYGFDCLLEFHQ